jgi:hypothetical protein
VREVTIKETEAGIEVEAKGCDYSLTTIGLLDMGIDTLETMRQGMINAMSQPTGKGEQADGQGLPPAAEDEQG